MQWWQIYSAVWLVALAVGAAFTWLFRGLAPKLGFLDRPLAEAHKRHGRTIPVLGGPAMFLAWLLTIAGGIGLALVGDHILPASVSRQLPGIISVSKQLCWLVGGAAALVILGVIDDRRPMHAFPKFFFQGLICAAVAAFGFRITLFYENPLATWAITTFWFLFIVNAINFLDNMDGLAGGIVAIAAFFFALIAGIRGQYFVTLLGAVTCGVACGFLLFNRPPASIFMGDAGSQFLGFCLGVLGASTTYFVGGETPTIAPVLIPLLILAVPVFDLFAVVVIRTRLGKPFYVGDNRHISHRFEQMGIGRPKAVLLVLLLVLASGAGAVTLLWLPPVGAALVFLQLAAILAIVSLLHAYVTGEKEP